MSQCFVNVTWSNGNTWNTRNLGVLRPNAKLTVSEKDLVGIVPDDTGITLLSLTKNLIPEEQGELPHLSQFSTLMPAWRASLGLSSQTAQASYQGEIDPFPKKASLLCFCPMLQFSEDIENFLIFINVEKNPIGRVDCIEVFDACRGCLIEKYPVSNNTVNVIPLSDICVTPDDLLVVVCRGMAGVPLFLARTKDLSCMTLEHTHPPGSLTVHGERWRVQKVLKESWFRKLNAELPN